MCVCVYLCLHASLSTLVSDIKGSLSGLRQLLTTESPLKAGA